jgi:hypothetical protein
MSEFYSKAQVDAQATVIGARIKARTTGAAIKTAYEAEANTNAFTDAEKSKLAGLESSKYRGLFTSAGALPLVGNAAGSYADVDTGNGSDVARWIWDNGDAKWVAQGAAGGTETAASIKTKYESNPDTNAFTDAEKTKLAGLVEAANITSFTAALDAALA